MGEFLVPDPLRLFLVAGEIEQRPSLLIAHDHRLFLPMLAPPVVQPELGSCGVRGCPLHDRDDLDPLDLTELLAVLAVVDLFDLEGMLLDPLEAGSLLEELLGAPGTSAVLRYLEEKKLGKKHEARSAELEIARSAKEAAWAAASMAKEANWRANLAVTIASVAAAAAISCYGRSSFTVSCSR
jgi:hypothetical protein